LSKQIWLAPILGNNRERLLERASDVLASGPAEALVYLAASRPLLDLAADRLLDGVRNRGVWGSLPVHLFRGFARYILATAVDEETRLPLAQRIAIDQLDLPLKRSLVSQIVSRLAREGRLKAIAPLAHREGCVNTVASLIGEIQRAGKHPAEFAAIVEARARDFYEPESDPAPQDPTAEQSRPLPVATPRVIPRQVDFDRDIAVVYSAYSSALARSGFTEDDADQLLALDVLRGELDGRRVTLPWLAETRLLVLDGFFDFTPVQGEMLRLLIPVIPEVIVNLNRDERNPEVFRAFAPTINQLDSIATFDTKSDDESQPLRGSLLPLRERLFNPLPAEAASLAAEPHEENGESRITLLECANRQTEIRAIAKRIKKCILIDGYSLGEIVLVVRQLAAYSETIVRVFEEESIPCSLRRRIQLTDVPAARAAVKLFELLIELSREGTSTPKVSALADIVKSGYFRLSDGDLDSLRSRFTQEAEHLLKVSGYRRGPEEANVGQWDADELENVIAFVGAELRLDRWIARARQLTVHAPTPTAEHDRKSDDGDQPEPDDPVIAAQPEPRVGIRLASMVEPVEVPLPGSERRAKPAREIHPASIAWSALVVERIGQVFASVPREAGTGELRQALMRLLEQLQFSQQVRGFAETSEREIAMSTLDLRALEGLRRTLSTAARSIEISDRGAIEDQTPAPIRLATFLDETMRCAKGQSLITSGADPGGLKVLEATDIRGLKFRTVFIAGLIEGGFPLRPSRDWIYPHEERERLKGYGLTLEDISPDTLLKEEHYFYQAACRATERLCLSRPLVSDDGSETVASYYVEEIIHAVAPSRITKEIIQTDYDGRTLFQSSRNSELATLLVRQEERPRHRAQSEGNFPPEIITRLITKAREAGYLSESAERRIAIERERGSRWFGRFDGLISDPRLLERLAKQHDTEHAFSASELSLYGRCPFKFFADRILKLEPRGEAALDLSALDAGSLLHEALRRFFERHRGERLTDLDPAGLRQELREVADGVFDEHESAAPPLNPQVWAIDREIRKLLLEQVLEYELSVEEKTQSKDVRPVYFELAFGMTSGPIDPHSTEQRLRLYRTLIDQTETLLLRGQIDRVDVAEDETAIAYDYKLSKGASLDDMQEGRALQLHIYLAALEQLLLPGNAIAGGGYYTIRGTSGRRNQGLYRVSMTEYTGVGKTTTSSLPDTDWKRIRGEMESRIWEFVDGMRAGGFAVKPSAPNTSCPRCDYSAVCRYEKFRIGRKDR
jgi:ATP-dependent helicase/nuclease subunit B